LKKNYILRRNLRNAKVQISHFLRYEISKF
jgi:hypothetical protein